MNLKNTNFNKDTTAFKIDLSNIKKDSKLYYLISQLNITRSNDIEHPSNIMAYINICTCDDSFLCEHRLQWIVDFIKNNFNER